MSLQTELNELFDIRTRKARQEKIISQEAQDVKREISLLILMFSQGISDLSVYINENEVLEWDGRVKRLIYHRGAQSFYLESVDPSILLRIRPFLKELVGRAKESCA